MRESRSDWQRWFFGRLRGAAMLIAIVVWLDWQPSADPGWFRTAFPLGLLWGLFFPEHLGVLRRYARRGMWQRQIVFVVIAAVSIAAYVVTEFPRTGAAVALGYLAGYVLVFVSAGAWVTVFTLDDDERSREAKRRLRAAFAARIKAAR